MEKRRFLPLQPQGADMVRTHLRGALSDQPAYEKSNP
jgi:hypothetical protein